MAAVNTNQHLIVSADLSATVIRANGDIEDHGIISAKSYGDFLRQLASKPKEYIRKMWLWMRRNHIIPMTLGFVAFHALLNGHGTTENMILFGLVTTTGVNYMASDFASNGVTPTISGFKFHDSGINTGVTAEAIGNTALDTAAGPARVSGTPSTPSANIYRSVATIAYTATKAITEWGLFSAATVGTIWDRRVFAVLNVVNGDSIQFTYNLTIPAGGS